jgi:hypothetical protein
MKTYLFEYYFEAAWWMIEIKADSAAEAQDRMNVLSHRAKYVGELQMKLPAGLGWFAKLWCWAAGS